MHFCFIFVFSKSVFSLCEGSSNLLAFTHSSFLKRNLNGKQCTVSTFNPFSVVANRHQRGVIGIPGSPGTLKIEFYMFKTGQLNTHTLGYRNSNYTLKIESCEVDLMKGTFEVQPQSNEVAENLALAFSLALLHVLCVPRPPGWKEGQHFKPPKISRGSRLIKTVPSDNMDLVLAAGLLWSTPSNYYIRSYYGIKACAMCGGGGCSGESGREGEGEGDMETETEYVVDFSEEYSHLESGGDDGYAGACCGINDDGDVISGCGGCGGCGGDSGTGGGGGGGGGGYDVGSGGGGGSSGGGGGGDHGSVGGGSVGGGSVGGGSAGGGSCGGGCGGGCGGD